MRGPLNRGNLKSPMRYIPQFCAPPAWLGRIREGPSALRARARQAAHNNNNNNNNNNNTNNNSNNDKNKKKKKKNSLL